MKIKEFIQWLIIILFLSSITACTTLPNTLNEFIWAAVFSATFWGGMFINALLECFE